MKKWNSGNLIAICIAMIQVLPHFLILLIIPVTKHLVWHFFWIQSQSQITPFVWLLHLLSPSLYIAPLYACDEINILEETSPVVCRCPSAEFVCLFPQVTFLSLPTPGPLCDVEQVSLVLLSVCSLCSPVDYHWFSFLLYLEAYLPRITDTRNTDPFTW